MNKQLFSKFLTILVVGVLAAPLTAEAASRKARAKRPTITSFSLIDAVTKKPISGYATITDGAVINLSTLPTTYINVRANTNSRGAQSVRFQVDGGKPIVDSAKPFAIAGIKKKDAPNWPATLGAHTITAQAFTLLKAKGPKGVAKTVTFTIVDQIEVDPSLPAIPKLAEWQENMLTFGAKHCDLATITALSTFEGAVWNYDGIRIYYQMADYTNDPKWNQCAQNVKSVYLPYVLTAGGNVPGWRIFPAGLYEDFKRTGDQNSRTAVELLATKSGFAFSAGSPDPNFSRETAFVLDAYIFGEQIGVPLDDNLKKAVDNALSHLNQWTVAQTADWVQPYIMAVTAEGLMTYYERTRDARIIPALTRAADWMWDNAWDESVQSFKYILCKPGSPNPECSQAGKNANDLNLLIAPVYAWLWRKTGEARFFERGDKIFAGGVDASYLGFPKQFSQNYRWSFEYVRLRSGKTS